MGAKVGEGGGLERMNDRGRQRVRGKNCERQHNRESVEIPQSPIMSHQAF